VSVNGGAGKGKGWVTFGPLLGVRLLLVAGVILEGGIVGPVALDGRWCLVDSALDSQARVLFLYNLLHHLDAVDAEVELLEPSPHPFLVVCEDAIGEQHESALLLSGGWRSCCPAWPIPP
jgi:hypothetical protein